MKLDAEIAKLMAETAKLNEETAKLNREIRWYEVVLISGLTVVFITIIKLFL